MKKILSIIIIIFLLSQIVAAYNVITMGGAAIDRPTSSSSRTILDYWKPAAYSGKITKIEIWADVTLENCEVATFDEQAANYFTTRDYETIGTVTAGAKRTFTVDLTVVAGDFIGIYYTAGNIERTDNEHVDASLKHVAGVDHIPCTNQFFGSTYGDDVMSVYATGETVPNQVTGVSATDGTHTDKVRVTWNVASGADKYYVWNGSSWIDVGNVTTWDHTGAPAPTITHGSCTASDGSSTAHIALNNAGASANVGSSISYKVKAWNTAGYGTESASNSGYRGVGALTYQWYRSNVDGDSGYGSIGGATASTYNDTGAPAPTITVGTASASDGTEETHVVLSIAGESANIGAGRYYKCYHTATGATPGYTGVNRGYRSVGSLTYQWQRSSGDADEDYSNIDGGTTDPYNDTGAPENGDGRYYKCVENATGATQQTTNADRGYRDTVVGWDHKWNTKTISKWNTKEIIKWNGLE